MPGRAKVYFIGEVHAIPTEEDAEDAVLVGLIPRSSSASQACACGRSVLSSGGHDAETRAVGGISEQPVLQEEKLKDKFEECNRYEPVVFPPVAEADAAGGGERNSRSGSASSLADSGVDNDDALSPSRRSRPATTEEQGRAWDQLQSGDRSNGDKLRCGDPSGVQPSTGGLQTKPKRWADWVSEPESDEETTKDAIRPDEPEDNVQVRPEEPDAGATRTSSVEPSFNGDVDSGPWEASPPSECSAATNTPAISTAVAEPVTSGVQADANADDAHDSQPLQPRKAGRRRRRKAKVAAASAASSSAPGRCDPMAVEAEPTQRTMTDKEAALLMRATLDFADKDDHEQALAAFARLMQSDVRAQLPIEQLYQVEHGRVKNGWQTTLHLPKATVIGGVRGSVQAAHRAALEDSMKHVVMTVHHIAMTVASKLGWSGEPR